MRYVFALLAALSWGLSPNFAKLGSNLGAPTVLGAMIAPLIAIPAFVLVLRSMNLRCNTLTYSRKTNVAIIGSGVFSILGTYFYWKGLSYGNVSVVVPLNSTYPLVTLFLTILLLKEEHVSRNTILGTFLMILGGVLVVL